MCCDNYYFGFLTQNVTSSYSHVFFFFCIICQSLQSVRLIEVNGGKWQIANANEFFLTLSNMYFISLLPLLFV